MKAFRLLAAIAAFSLCTAAQAVVIGPIAGSWDGTEDVQAGRIFRDGVASTCAAPKTYPGLFSGASQLYESFSFSNAGAEDCVTIDVTVSSTDTHFSVYLSSYDPSNLGLNYLGDIGASLSQPFSVLVPAFSEFVVVASTNFGPDAALRQTFSFTVEGDNVTVTGVPEPATLLLFGAGLLAFAGHKRRLNR